MAAPDQLDSQARHRRSLRAVAAAALRTENYSGLFKTVRNCEKPVDFLKRYIANGGSYPARIGLRTPTSPIQVSTYSPDDVQTINEIFFRGDYESGEGNTIVVDFGSNIGISAIYFLSRNADCRVYCYEPLPQNVARLRDNLAAFAGRFEVEEVAVGVTAGTVRFGWEPTGRYGGVGRETGHWIDVKCLDSNEVLAEIIARHGRIDVLKVDIETLEKAVTERIPRALVEKIGQLVIEFPFTENPFVETHDMIRRNYVTAFKRRQRR